MRHFFFLILCLQIGACGPRSVANPAADAKTYAEEEYNQDSLDTLQGTQAEKVGLKIRMDIISSVRGEAVYKVVIPEKIETVDAAQVLRQQIENELERIAAFQKKYEGSFRLRYKNGDLKLLTLTESALKRIAAVKGAWEKALAELDEFALR